MAFLIDLLKTRSTYIAPVSARYTRVLLTICFNYLFQFETFAVRKNFTLISNPA